MGSRFPKSGLADERAYWYGEDPADEERCECQHGPDEHDAEAPRGCRSCTCPGYTRDEFYDPDDR